jgi:hypothetical protein
MPRPDQHVGAISSRNLLAYTSRTVGPAAPVGNTLLQPGSAIKYETARPCVAQAT